MWVVHLDGDESDLAALSYSLCEGAVTVSHDGQNYVLMSDQFETTDDAEIVRQRAIEFIDVLNGASRLALDSVHSICVGNVYRNHEDGGRDAFLFPETAAVRFRTFAPTVTLTHTDGTIEKFHPADPVNQWARLASNDESVANVFRLLAAGPLDWVNLYRILEIIQTDIGGQDAIVQNDWATKSSMRLFKHTANSPKAVGLDSRHGADNKQPPRQPMQLAEARALITSVVHGWLRSKGS